MNREYEYLYYIISAVQLNFNEFDIDWKSIKNHNNR